MARHPILLRFLLALMGAALWSLAAQAQEASEACPGLVASRRLPIVPASLGGDEVRLTFVGHATFLIETAAGVRIATDYNDYVRPAVVPDIVTMNHAHSTHYTLNPDPGIRHVLRGWGGTRHDLQVQDVRIRNVATNIRDWGNGTEMGGNSIFVFETAGLCIAHLGHLHHTLTPEHLKQLGRIDVVLVPVDGSYTLDSDGMSEVLQALNAPVMIPMHFFGETTLNHFIERSRQRYAILRQESPSIVLSRATLPGKATVIVLPGH